FAAPSSRAIVGPPCLSWGGSPLVFKPAKARKGADLNPDGGNGRRGRTATARCRGDIQLNGALIVGQDGGDGGNGTRSSSAGPTATGGDGGEGGKVILKSAGAVIGSGTIRGGRGGNGGNGTASGIMTRNGPKASSATAIGGNGAMSGLVEVRGKTGISADLVIDVQQGGDGGNGTATGADGEDSDDTDAAQEGGNATATGGRGGDAPDKTLNQSDQGVTGAVTVTGGNGGQGGVAEAIAGKGGDGTTRQNKAGAAGGNLSATGGNGGDANLKALGGAPVGTGGDGGNALVKRGFGGNGWSDCKVQLTSGGAAGNGGSASGMPGSGGSGTPAGSAGETIASNAAGNGGAGGDGYGPATGGTAGADTRTGTKNDAPPVFQDGADGAGCPVPTTWTVKTDVPDHESVLQLTVEPHTILATLEDDQLTLEIGESAFTLQVVTTLVGTSFSGSGGSFVKLTTFGPRSGTVDVMGDLDPTTGMFTAMITLTVFGQPVTYDVSGTYPAESP
ncbi:MAG: hypothetical protein R2909_08340, partial [Gemmatimonadales bacterium]